MSDRQDYRWENLNERLTKLEQDGIPGLRDFIACSALSCLATQKTVDWYTPEEVAKYVYQVADAVLKERNHAEGSS